MLDVVRRRPVNVFYLQRGLFGSLALAFFLQTGLLLFLELVIFVDDIEVLLLRFVPFLDNGASCDGGSREGGRLGDQCGIRVWPGLLLLNRVGSLDSRLEAERGCVELSISSPNYVIELLQVPSGVFFSTAAGASSSFLNEYLTGAPEIVAAGAAAAAGSSRFA